VKLIRTRDGAQGGSATLNATSVSAVAVHATTASHIATVNGVDQTPALAPNTAGASCTSPAPTLTSLTLNPTTVPGGGTSTGTVTLSAAAPSTGVVVTLSSGNTTVATVPASVTVTANATSASFTIQSKTVPTSTSVTLSATLAGVTKSAALGVSAPTPVKSIGLSTVSYTFGSVALGTSSTATITLTSTGNTAVTISGITTTGDYTQTTDCQIAPNTFAPGQQCHVWVTFTPTATGTRSGELTITSDGIGSPQKVQLDGSGYVAVPGISVTPTSLGFGTLYIGTTTSGRVVKISSTGTAPLVISSVDIGGTNPGDFSIWNDTCSGASLAPNTYCTLSVSFEPLRTGTRTATLIITHNAPGSPGAVSLSGAGATPPGGYIP
jgi:hypothetical protein